MHPVNLMPVAHIIQTAAMEADNLANTLQADAPEAAVYVLNELDAVAGCLSFADLMAEDAALSPNATLRALIKDYEGICAN